jgi:hypothetical protein
MELTYDLQSLPKGMSIEEFLNFVRIEKIVFWDSSRGSGIAPIVELDSDLQIKDISKDLTS